MRSRRAPRLAVAFAFAAMNMSFPCRLSRWRMGPFAPLAKRLIGQIQILQHIAILDLREIHIVIAHGPERFRSRQHDQFIDETSRLGDGLPWPYGNGRNELPG